MQGSPHVHPSKHCEPVTAFIPQFRAPDPPTASLPSDPNSTAPALRPPKLHAELQLHVEARRTGALHPLQSSMFLKRVSETKNWAFLAPTAFQLKLNRRQGPLLETRTVGRCQTVLSRKEVCSKCVVQQAGTPITQSLRPDLESFSVEAGPLASPLLEACTVPLHTGPLQEFL